MSTTEQADAFSNALAKAEERLNFDGPRNQTTARMVHDAFCHEVQVLKSRDVRTAYSTTIEAFERISSLRQRTTRIWTHSAVLDEVFDSVAISMIEGKADSQLAIPKVSTTISLDIAWWDRRLIGRLGEWLGIARKLIKSFGAGGLVMKSVNSVIVSEVSNLVSWWNGEPSLLIKGRTKIHSKLKALTGLSNPTDYPWIAEDINDVVDQLRPVEDQLNAIDSNEHGLSQQQSPDSSLATSADERRLCEQEIEELQTTVLGLEQNLQDLNTEKDKFENSTKELDKIKELLVEAEEDRATTMKENSRIIAENERLQDCMTAMLQAKVGMADQIERLGTEKVDLTRLIEHKQIKIDEAQFYRDGLSQSLEEATIRVESLTEEKEGLVTVNADLETALSQETNLVEQKRIQIDELKLNCEGLTRSLEEANLRASNLVVEKETLATANADLETSLSTAKDSHAVLSKDIQDIKTETAKRTTEIGYALEVMSDLKGQKEYWRQRTDALEEDKIELIAQLAEAKDSLLQATSTITAANVHDLTAENFRLERDLEAANNVLTGIKALPEPKGTSTGTVSNSNVIVDAQTQPANILNANGEDESEAGFTILTPASTIDADES